MKKCFMVVAALSAGLLAQTTAYAADWGQVQDAGRTYYETWKKGDKQKTAEALKLYEQKAAEAYNAERAGEAVPTTVVLRPESSTKGKQQYEAACMACHGTGIAGAPKVGDKASWAPRIAQGETVLVEHAVQGFQGKTGMMPPKGGANITDSEVKEAVKYMVSVSK